MKTVDELNRNFREPVLYRMTGGSHWGTADASRLVCVSIFRGFASPLEAECPRGHGGGGWIWDVAGDGGRYATGVLFQEARLRLFDVVS